MMLGLIPARSGSKGIPHKNTKPIAGHPLLWWTAQAARDSDLCDRLVLTTDSEDIAAVGRACGLETPFLRPTDLAQDDTPMFNVVAHALCALDDPSIDTVVLLQPTSPLRQAWQLTDAYSCLTLEADSVVSVAPIPSTYSPDMACRLSQGRLYPYQGSWSNIATRQAAQPAYRRTGTVYIIRRRTIEAGSLYGTNCRPYIESAEASVSIDTSADWDRAERLLASRGS